MNLKDVEIRVCGNCMHYFESWEDRCDICLACKNSEDKNMPYIEDTMKCNYICLGNINYKGLKCLKCNHIWKVPYIIGWEEKIDRCPNCNATLKN